MDEFIMCCEAGTGESQAAGFAKERNSMRTKFLIF